MRTISKRAASDRVFMLGVRIEVTQLILKADGRYPNAAEYLQEAKDRISQAVREIDGDPS